jgi:hypothetical protein
MRPGPRPDGRDGAPALRARRTGRRPVVDLGDEAEELVLEGLPYASGARRGGHGSVTTHLSHRPVALHRRYVTPVARYVTPVAVHGSAVAAARSG